MNQVEEANKIDGIMLMIAALSVWITIVFLLPNVAHVVVLLVGAWMVGIWIARINNKVNVGYWNIKDWYIANRDADYREYINNARVLINAYDAQQDLIDVLEAEIKELKEKVPA